MDVLEFASELFVHMGPNEQAWAATMMKYLKARGHEFATADSLCRRFANALLHYQVLVHLINAEMAKIIDSFSGPLTYPVLDETTPIPFRNYTNAHNSAGHVQDGPSIYLQSWCPLCFGGSHTSGLGVSTIACIDANFQIKHNHDKDWQKGFEAVPGEDDAVEPGMNVPNSVLNTCGDSFIAADGDRIKASTQQFDDTGLMALLCHHDIALYVANMRTPGKKQFYAFALIMALFKELPEWWTVGILYDIACQIH
ncbi:hypothetical protein BS47DRAFT_1308549 [Hydnum rufescens UP504]|uniref:CxC2-like cysteine cluster KDZ transposase-associated domain-containing protein n=1 Tax=Hydnum rufescens UP504 TaxID=1448309 RepID=A0A9P6DI15_9AGAM|nr:hypothetical protein BS47DRAFT_1308549 [Hydnum rufescens UP504]